MFLTVWRVLPLLNLLPVIYTLQPLMKHLINLGTHFIGFRDEADNFRGKAYLIFGDSLSSPST
jgi:hypothetical protein